MPALAHAFDQDVRNPSEVHGFPWRRQMRTRTTAKNERFETAHVAENWYAGSTKTEIVNSRCYANPDIDRSWGRMVRSRMTKSDMQLSCGIRISRLANQSSPFRLIKVNALCPNEGTLKIYNSRRKALAVAANTDGGYRCSRLIGSGRSSRRSVVLWRRKHCQALIAVIVTGIPNADCRLTTIACTDLRRSLATAIILRECGNGERPGRYLELR